MKKKTPSHLEASVKQRLLNLSVEKGDDFYLILTRYVLERFLYRIGKSRYKSQLILKGAMLFPIWMGTSHRPTRDLDFLGFGDDSPDRLINLFQEICRMEVEPDGLLFDENDIRVEDIRADQEYQGKRILIIGYLGKAKSTLQIDIGFGDIVTPEAQETQYPTLLDFPPPIILIYSKETFISEKLQAMIFFGMVNSRMKDYYDIWIISRRFPFQGNLLALAINRTFNRRSTEIPKDIPSSLTEMFADDKGKRTQWKAFLKRNRLAESETELSKVVSDLRDFIMPVFSSIVERVSFPHTWDPGGPWSDKG